MSGNVRRIAYGVLVFGVATGAHAAAPAAGSPMGQVLGSSTGTFQAELHGVGGVSSMDVWAVGDSYNGVTEKTLIRHWDGSTWTRMPSPNPGTGFRFLEAVSADSATDAWTVGSYNPDPAAKTLIEHWDGTSWTRVPSPSPGSAKGRYLGDVSAISPRDVWAVGDFEPGAPGKTLIEHWDGTNWRTVPSPNPGPSAVLRGVSAVSSSDLWAAGSFYRHGRYRTLLVHWDGTRWTAMPGSHAGVLYGVSAVSATDVWAVGSFTPQGGGQMRCLLEHWDGTSWSAAPSPKPGGHVGCSLEGVSASSAQDIWAVGFAGEDEGAGLKTLIEHWDGASWTKVAHPRPPDQVHTDMLGILDLSATDAWAVGWYVHSGIDSALTEHWDGTKWRLI